jgi:hypothetical protein
VLNERRSDAETNRVGSLLYRMLALKRRHPLAEQSVLPVSFDFGVERKQACPTLAQMDGFEAQHPDWGMPFGLPGLEPAEEDLVARWLELGASDEGLPPLPPVLQAQIVDWESFLGGDSLKQRLVARYLYEHLFLALLHFDSDPEQTRFRLVRSSTPSGQPIRGIPTRRPYDDPRIDRVYYRLDRVRESIVEKTDMPYVIGPGRLGKLRAIFFDPSYPVVALPSYEVDVASNPFVAFAAIPARARYRFLLDEAQLTMMGFIKGPVCRGQLALNAIEDQFWVFFADPDADPRDLQDDFLKREAHNLGLPTAWGSASPIVVPWLEYKHRQDAYLVAKSKFLEKELARFKVDLSLIWNGGGRGGGGGANPNAALTVFRHFDSASVVQGLVGPAPKTVWVLTYPDLERIHYLLVAGYDVFGNIGHHLNTRLYMDFLRMEAEFNFLVLLPRGSRKPVRDFWYRGASDAVKNHVYGGAARLDRETDIVYRTDDPKSELLMMLSARVAPALDHPPTLASTAAASASALRRAMGALAGLRGPSLSFLPETVILRIDGPGAGASYFTILRNTGHRNVSNLFGEDSRVLPAEHTLTVVPGFMGAYPNALYVVPSTGVETLTAAIAGLASAADYARLMDHFAIRRTNRRFWAYADAMQAAHASSGGGHHGLLDLSRFENR